MGYIPDFEAEYDPANELFVLSGDKPVFDFTHAGEDECESRVIFAVMVSPSARKEIRPILGVGGAKWFKNPVWKDVYANLIERDETQNEYWVEDILDWISRTQGEEANNNQYFTVRQLFAECKTACTAIYYARQLVEYGRVRFARILGDTLLKSEAIDADSIATALRELEIPGADAPRTLKEILPEVIEQSRNDETKVSTGFDGLDALLSGGLGRGHLLIIGARTGRGKTAISVNLSINAAIAGVRVLFYALEMSDAEILNRAIRVRTGVLPNGADFERAAYETAGLPIKIAKASKCTVTDIEVAIDADVAAGTPPGLVVVDYLQLLLPRQRTSNRQEQVAEVSRDLKRLARITGIPVISPSQLRRPTDEDDDSKPALHHLRESGSIEQDADAVLLLSGKDAREHDCMIVRAELAKNRHGKTGTVYFDFHLPTQRFIERAGC